MNKALCLTTVTSALLLTACHTVQKLDPVATVTRVGPSTHQIELQREFSGYGGPCLLLPIPYRDTVSNWLYVQRLEGELPANEVVLSHKQGEVRPPYTVKSLEGTITFT